MHQFSFHIDSHHPLSLCESHDQSRNCRTSNGEKKGEREKEKVSENIHTTVDMRVKNAKVKVFSALSCLMDEPLSFSSFSSLSLSIHTLDNKG